MQECLNQQSNVKATKQSSVLVYTVSGCFVAFTILYSTCFCQGRAGEPAWHLVLIFKGALEFISVFYAISFIVISIAYLLSDLNVNSNINELLTYCPPVGIVYLCCEDINQRALKSLCTLEYAGKLYLIIHDDSTNVAVQSQVDSIVAEIRHEFPGEVLILRRTEKEWGKPGVINYVVENTSHLYDYFVLCDNDSTTITKDAIPRALAYFNSSDVAIVQFRNTAIVDEQSSWINSILSEAIDVFDVFIATAPKWGWQPFLGHNAMLSVAAFLKTGGMKPLFADDIDLSIRLNLRGYKIVYAGDITFGEEHPHSYTAFCTRTYKWAYGCMQVLREHGWSVLSSRNLSFCEKWYLFLLMCFYLIQALLILYMGTSYVLLPLLLRKSGLEFWQILLGDTLTIIAVFAYTWAYFLKRRKLFKWFRFALICAIVYGGTGLVSMKGTWDCLRGKKRKWVPTNRIHSPVATQPIILAEPLLSGLLLCMSYSSSRALPNSPLFYLFAGVYLTVPLIACLYRVG